MHVAGKAAPLPGGAVLRADLVGRGGGGVAWLTPFKQLCGRGVSLLVPASVNEILQCRSSTGGTRSSCSVIRLNLFYISAACVFLAISKRRGEVKGFSFSFCRMGLAASLSRNQSLLSQFRHYTR